MVKGNLGHIGILVILINSMRFQHFGLWSSLINVVINLEIWFDCFILCYYWRRIKLVTCYNCGITRHMMYMYVWHWRWLRETYFGQKRHMDGSMWHIIKYIDISYLRPNMLMNCNVRDVHDATFKCDIDNDLYEHDK